MSSQRRAKGSAAKSRGSSPREVHGEFRKLAARLEELGGDVEGLRNEARVTEVAVSELRHVDARQALRAVQRRLNGFVADLETESKRLGTMAASVDRLDARIEDVDRTGQQLTARSDRAAEATRERLRELHRENRVLRKELAEVVVVGNELASLRRIVAQLQARELERERPGRISIAARGIRRRARRIWRLARRRTARFLRRARVRSVRLLRRARVRSVRLLRRAKAKIRRGLRAVRRRLLRVQLGSFDQHPPTTLRVPRRYRRRIALENPPAISMVTPSLNQGRFVGKTIRSVLDQHYPRLEYIVQDGGSTDETHEIVEGYRSRLHRCEFGPDKGQANAINLGFAHASGEIMAYLNADDLLLPGTLSYVARYLQRHPEVDAVYGHRVIVDEHGMEIGRWILPRHDDEVLSWVDYLPQETLFWRRRLWEKAGARLDEESRFALDWELVLRFRDAGARIVRLPRFLGAFRVHEEQKTSAQMETAGIREMARIRERIHGRKVPQAEIGRNTRGYMLRHVALRKLYRARLLRY